jgi:hypothetical protein
MTGLAGPGFYFAFLISSLTFCLESIHFLLNFRIKQTLSAAILIFRKKCPYINLWPKTNILQRSMDTPQRWGSGSDICQNLAHYIPKQKKGTEVPKM